MASTIPFIFTLPFSFQNNFPTNILIYRPSNLFMFIFLLFTLEIIPCNPSVYLFINFCAFFFPSLFSYSWHIHSATYLTILYLWLKYVLSLHSPLSVQRSTTLLTFSFSPGTLNAPVIYSFTISSTYKFI